MVLQPLHFYRQLSKSHFERMRQNCQCSSDWGGKTTGVQYFLDDVYLDLSIKCSTQLPNCAADASLLHFPTIQHLVHHLRQAIAVIVMLNGLYFHSSQAQSPPTTLPFVPDVFPQQFQVLLSHSVVL